MLTATQQLPPAPAAEAAAASLENARRKAAVALEVAVETLALRLGGETSVRSLLDMSEHFHKVSGAAAKQQAAVGPSFKVAFNFNAGPGGRAEVVIEQEADPLEELGELPPAALAFAVTQDLASPDVLAA